MTGVSTPDGQVGVSKQILQMFPENPDDDSDEGPSQFKYILRTNGEQKVFIIDYQ